MQYEKDLQSAHKDLFLQAKEFLLTFDGIVETKKKRITNIARCSTFHIILRAPRTFRSLKRSQITAMFIAPTIQRIPRTVAANGGI